jgi:AraC family transcriptional regulator
MKQDGSSRCASGGGGNDDYNSLFEDGTGRLPRLNARFVELRPGMTAALYRGTGQEETHADLINNSPYVHFTCLLKDRSRTQVRGRELSPDIGEGYVVFAPGERFSVDYGPNYAHVDLMLLPETLAELTGDDGSGLDDEISGGFVMQGTPPGQRMIDAALRLAEHVEAPQGQRLYLYAAALEFLAGHLGGGAPDPIPPRERQRLIAARARLLRDLSAAPTIAELAREIGLNQLKLKQGFKTLFGSSIYALFQQHRMEYARQLLRSHSVTETALMLGYNNLSHFSTAFRKQFGILPRHERKGLTN